MFLDILFALWFFLPAGLANASPVFANKIPILGTLGMPLDGGKHFRGKRIFGDHKTVRGLAVGTLTGSVTGAIQYVVFQSVGFIQNMSLTDYRSFWWAVLLGALLGFGALAGDAVKSFFKRQFSVPSGKSWFPFDQIDYIVGGLLASSLVVDLPQRSAYIWIGLVWFLIHPAATFVGWLLGLKESPI
jgi:CDP-2,3-bis-(O-geranylgeranyl)-sn-glycerol synthase